MHTSVKDSRWNCHDHRDQLEISDSCTVYHPLYGQLSYYEVYWDRILYYPIVFKSKFHAYDWVDKGYISELQEGLGTLHVAFSRVSIENR